MSDQEHVQEITREELEDEAAEQARLETDATDEGMPESGTLEEETPGFGAQADEERTPGTSDPS